MDPKQSSDIDLATLVIAAVASAAAAYITSEVWAGGTILTAAITPVIVALVKESLHRPVSRVRERRTGEFEAVGVRRWWKVGLASGLAAFVLVLAIFTIPELVTGKSIGRSGDGATTFFGGTQRTPAKSKRSDKPEVGGKANPAETASPTETPEKTPTPEPTPSPTPTVTTAPSATPSSSPSG